MSERRDSLGQVASQIPFDNNPTGGDPIFTESSPENVQEAIESSGELGTVAFNTPRYTILLQNNGTLSDGTVIGYDSLIPGDDTPIIIPVASEIMEFTFSNSRASADYTLIFRKNSLVATPFYTVSKVNTQFFSDNLISEEFAAGDQIYVEYQDDGQNASDAVILLTFKALPPP